MSKTLATKNVAAVLLAVVMTFGFAFAFATPAKADAISDLQAQIQSLLAQIAALQGGSMSNDAMMMSASCHTFSRSHSVGDTGGEVMWIQQFLNGHGYQVAASGAGSPGNETSSFGPRTKAAVAAWQASAGISPAAGYWGPITRARANAICAATPTPTPTPTPGPTPGPTPAPGDTTLHGSAGSATVTQTSEDVEDQVFTDTTRKVLGFKVEGSGGDIRVTNVRVKFTAAVDSTASDRLSNYAREISIWAAGQKIATMSPNDFVRDSAGVYSASIPVSQIIRMGSSNKTTFHVGFTANSTIDTDDKGSTNDWSVNLVQTRYTDATGVTLFDTTTGITNAGVYVDRLSSSSDVKFRMGEGSAHPKAGNVQVSETSSKEVTLAEFTLKAEGADMSFDTLTASSTIGGVGTNGGLVVQTFYLMRGTTRIAERSVFGSGTGTALSAAQSGPVIFALDSTERLAKDSTQTYRLIAKVNLIGTGTGSASAFDQGDTITASTSPAVGDINAKSDSDGKTIIAGNRTGSITTYTQTLYSKGIQISKVSENVTISNNATAPANSFGTLKMNVRVTVFGSDDVYIPLNANATTTTNFSTYGLAYKIVRADGTATSTGASGPVSRISGGTIVAGTPDLLKISGGSTADIELNVTFNPQADGGAANTLKQWRLELVNAGHRADATATVAATNVTAAPAEDFRTSYSAAIDN